MQAGQLLADPATHCATIEKEMLAIIFTLEKWYQFVFGLHVVVRTDHKPLKAIIRKPQYITLLALLKKWNLSYLHAL